MGVNSRLDTIQAAILLPKLVIFDEELALRQLVAKRYDELLNAAGVESTPYVDIHNISVYAQYTIRIARREIVQEKLKAKGVPTAVHYPIPLNKQPAVSSNSCHLPIGDAVAMDVMSLPMSPYLTDDDIGRVVEILVEEI